MQNIKIKKDINTCSQGDILARDIYNDAGVLMVSCNTQLNPYILNSLREKGIRELFVYESIPEINEVKEKIHINEFKQEYDNNVSQIKEVLNDIVTGKRLDLNKIEKISDSLYRNVKSNFSIIECVSEMKSADEYTYAHSVNVALYAMLIGNWCGLQASQIYELILAGMLHDIGKAKIPDQILNKRGPLEPDEFEIMKKHTIYGYNICKDLAEISNDVKKTVLMHHEKVNGKGYPLGVPGDKINLYSKIVSVADVYDALTSERVYKKRKTPFETFTEFELIGIGTGVFDTKILLTFLANISSYYTGSKVKINTGETGEVVYVPPHSISTPVVRVGNNYMDLGHLQNIKIVEMI